MSIAATSRASHGGADAYSFEQCKPGYDIIFAEPVLLASRVKKRIRELDPRGETRREILTLFADTFVLDDPQLGAPSTFLAARVIDVTAAAPFMLSGESPFPFTGVQILTQQVWNGKLRIMSGQGKEWQPPPETQKSLEVGRGPVVVTAIVEQANFDTQVASFDDRRDPRLADAIADVTRHPQLWNTLKGQFAAACIGLSEPARLSEGVAQLRWIVLCTQGIVRAGGGFAAEAAQLNHQASALLLFAGGGGPRYVPVWSEAYLKGRIDDFLGVLRNYEDRIRTLEVREDIKHTVQAFSSTLREVSVADEKALETIARINEGEIKALEKQYQELLWSYELQEHNVRLSFIIFKGGLAESATIKMTIAVLQIIGAAAQFAGAAYGANVPDPKAAEKAAETAASKGREMGDLAEEISRALVDAVKAEIVATMQRWKAQIERMIKMGKAAAQAMAKAAEIDKAKGMEARGTIELPDLSEMAVLDPEADWNIFIVKVEVLLREFIDGGDGGGSVKGAREYYIALRTLAEYGRSLGAKAVAIARLQSRALEISAQLNAARFATSRWELLHEQAKTAGEKLSICRAMMLQAELNTKRSLLVMAEGYRAAYAYNHLQETPLQLRLIMDHAAMADEFYSIKNDVAELFLPPTHVQEVTTDFFELPVVGADANEFPSRACAVLRLPPSPGAGKPVLSWTTPIADPPFQKWLSDGRRSIYFIQEARFYLDGAEPDADGVIRLRVATTGTYANGYGAPPVATFVSQGTALDFGYEPKSAEPPFARWRPVGRTKDNYMSPTPFTTWTATIERAGSLAGLKTLRMKLWLLRQDASA